MSVCVSFCLSVCVCACACGGVLFLSAGHPGATESLCDTRQTLFPQMIRECVFSCHIDECVWVDGYHGNAAWLGVFVC